MLRVQIILLERENFKNKGIDKILSSMKMSFPLYWDNEFVSLHLHTTTYIQLWLDQKSWSNSNGVLLYLYIFKN